MKYTSDGMGFIDLVDHLGSDLTVANSARVSFGKRRTEFGPNDRKLLEYLWKNEHTSPFRHCMLQFHIKMPEFCARQMYKHIIGSNYSFKDTGWNEISGRYVEITELWSPAFLRQRAENKKQGSLNTPHPKSNAYISEITDLQRRTLQLYSTMLEDGVAPEQARTILPVSFFTEFYWTASLQAVLHFLHLRTAEDTQAELREYALIMEEFVKELFPNSWEVIKG